MEAEREHHGIMAEFETPEALLKAAEHVYEAGYRQMDAYTPFPVEGLAEAIGFTKNRIPLIVLIGGLIGTATAYGMQYWMTVVDYPINVGGRPLHSWPSFIPITFELTILFAAFAAVFGMLVLNKLPQPYHPSFEVPAFVRASQDRFFLAIEASDPAFDAKATRTMLQKLNPTTITDIKT